MTPEERIARLEARADGQDAWLEKIDAKVDRLVELASSGKGALSLFWKVAAFGGAVIAAFAWLYDKVPHHK